MLSKEDYRLNSDTSLQKPLISIYGNNITVDFNNAVLLGSNDQEAPNKFYGVAIKIEKGSTNITIINARVHGYKIAVLADSVEGLHIYNSDFSYNYRQQLHSNWQREDASDWMSYHHNEHGEWMRYGAGIYLNNCNKAVIKGNTVTGGQCGLMMTRCEFAEVYDNNFSFNSGLGVGMYRSSYNRVYGNILDFNVRGYSDGIYSRGQDSGGILVFEQCNNNVFSDNSATHSGDGFFLWAGQYTMDSGEGGCNDNMLYSNDFSYAPTNGIELTFSRNLVEYNIIKECDNGIWGGYSYETKIYNNQIAGNHTGIAIEHGQENEVLLNAFKNNNTAIKLWGHANEPADWGYAKYRNTKSNNYKIYKNNFNGNNTLYDVMETDSVSIGGNHDSANGLIYKIGKGVSALDTIITYGIVDLRVLRKSMARGKDFIMLDKINTKLPKTVHPGRNQIHVTEWGPYNFKYPLLWLQQVDSAGLYHFEVLHPGGKWAMNKLTGFAIVSQNKDSLIAKADSSVTERSINLYYIGAVFTDAFGKQHKAAEPYEFSFNECDYHPQWSINFYKWDSLHSPAKDFTSFFQSLQTPVYSTTAKKIDYTWWGAIGKGLPADTFATIAISSMDLPEKDYEVSITGDDLMKLYIDDKPVIDAWDATYVDLDENTNHTVRLHLGGKHAFKIVHAEISGLATLMFYLKPVKIQ